MPASWNRRRNDEAHTLAELFEASRFVDRDCYPARVELIRAAMAAKQKGKYQCPKCGGGAYDANALFGATSRMQRVLDFFAT